CLGRIAADRQAAVGVNRAPGARGLLTRADAAAGPGEQAIDGQGRGPGHVAGLRVVAGDHERPGGPGEGEPDLPAVDHVAGDGTGAGEEAAAAEHEGADREDATDLHVGDREGAGDERDRAAAAGTQGAYGPKSARKGAGEAGQPGQVDPATGRLEDSVAPVDLRQVRQVHHAAAEGLDVDAVDVAVIAGAAPGGHAG